MPSVVNSAVMSTEASFWSLVMANPLMKLDKGQRKQDIPKNNEEHSDWESAVLSGGRNTLALKGIKAM